ncbi:MAG: hypothetical protein GY847_32850 [Proteobacteria bacterium]|nr:hypothetical protein [Pseudomonadota bacterium]
MRIRKAFSQCCREVFQLKGVPETANHANTPDIAILDTLGRQFLTKKLLDPTTELETRIAFDITGKPLIVTDPRDNTAFQYTYDMLGTTLRTINIDAGDDRVFSNVMGNPVASFDARGHKITAEYDALHRLTKKTVTGNDLNNVVERLKYGESIADPEKNNHRGQLYQHYDQSGRMRVLRYDIKGQPLRTRKWIRTEYKTEANWPNGGGWGALLEGENHTTRFEYDALGRVILQINPDTSRIKPEYHTSGKLDKIWAKPKGASSGSMFVNGITYNAKGQRERITYGNGTETDYTYEDETFRLTSLATTRTNDSNVMQDITYVYDPVGNIVKVTDDSHNRIFGTGGPVEPKQEYTYDSLYRLLSATGREHNALSQTPFFNDPNQFKQSRHTLLNDMGLLSTYTRNYTYDDAGNLYELQHLGTNPFTRELDVDTATNRALLHEDGVTPNFAGCFDANGNQTEIDHIANLAWNYRDNIASATILERTSDNNDAEYYVYDASGQRTRKVKETFENGETVKRVEEKVYLGGVEIKRTKTVDVTTSTETLILDRSDLHVMDDKARIAIVNHWTQDDLLTEIEDTNWLNTNRARYQYSNHLGSTSLELNTAGQIISYEEYYPYGGTSFIAGNNDKEVKLKEYRYTGKERDDSTGLYYYGARYYAPWLGRWLSADPAGPVDGLNLYVYVSGNPVRLNDPSGTEEGDCVGQCTMEPMKVQADKPAVEKQAAPKPEGKPATEKPAEANPATESVGKGGSSENASKKPEEKTPVTHVVIAFEGWNAPWESDAGEKIPLTEKQKTVVDIVTHVKGGFQKENEDVEVAAFASDTGFLTGEQAKTGAMKFITENLSFDEGKQTGKVVLYGYSWGGDTAIELAQTLEAKGIAVEMLVTVDPALGPASSTSARDFIIPENVKTNVNYYTTTPESSVMSQGGKNFAKDPSKTNVANIEFTGPTHAEMDERTAPGAKMNMLKVGLEGQPLGSWKYIGK